MKQIILSSAFLPPIAYFQAIANSDSAIIDHFEDYAKQSYRNRALILSANGPLALIVPILKCKPHTPIHEVLIDYKMPWQRTHWRAITAAYNNSPYFIYYCDYLYPFFSTQISHLTDFNFQILQTTAKLLALNTPMLPSTEKIPYSVENVRDYRNIIHPKKELPEALVCSEQYTQVFTEKMPFVPNLSILDLLFNQGPQAKEIIKK